MTERITFSFLLRHLHPQSLTLRYSRALPGWALLGLCLWVAMGPAWGQSSGKLPPRKGDYILAVVNQELITAAELDMALERTRLEMVQAGQTPPPEAELRQKVLDALIEERVLLTHTKEYNTKVDESEVDRAVANMAAQNRLTLDQFKDALKEAGLNMKDYRERLRQQILLERLRDSQVRRSIVITDAEVQGRLEEETEKARAKTSIQLAQILLGVPDAASQDQWSQREQQARELLQRIQAGASFEELARSESDDKLSAPLGGDLGLRKPERLPDLFIAATRDTPAGQLVPKPVRSPAGFHVLKVLAREESSLGAYTQTLVRHILIRPKDANAEADALRRLTQIRKAIAQGEVSFEDAAKAHSEDASAARGGDLGWASPGTMVPEFEQAMNALAPKDISEPVGSRFGLHLIQVQERRPAQMTDAQMRDRIRQILREERFSQAYENWVKDQRARAFVEMRETPP
jgi:peptidyl-prolyl cis-trans isomerase SurA